MTAPNFREYLDNAGQLPDSVVLGSIVYFTITTSKTATVTHAQLDRLFDELGLNPDFIPKPNRPVDAYKKATSAVALSYPIDKNRHVNIMVRDAGSTRDSITRALVREVVDERRKQLGYGQIGWAIFDHAPLSLGGARAASGHRIRFVVHTDLVPAEEHAVLDQLRRDVISQYDHEVQFVDSPKLRMMVREYIRYLNAVEMKPSMYFVHKSRSDELIRLRTLIERLGNGSSMHMIPLVDLPEQRKEVVARFQAEAVEHLSSLVTDIAELKANRKKITVDQFTKFKARYDDIAAKAGEYTRTLAISQVETGAAMELALDAIYDLQDTAAEAAAERLLAGAESGG